MNSCVCVPLLACLIASTLAAAANPPGSYQQTCNPVNVVGSTLHATCKTRNGGLKQTQLVDFQQCVGDISNIDGNLQCNKGAPPPPGSYAQTCQGPYMSGTTLNASCKTSSGQWVSTSLQSVDKCVGDISNQEGILRCSKGPLPTGSYQQSCRDYWVDNGVLNASCNDGFNPGAYLNNQLGNVTACRGDIYNVHGHLTCVTGTGDAPQGSYRETCWNLVVNGNTLSADCFTSSYGPSSTSMSGFNTCRSPLYNFNGGLCCNRGTADPPPGSYQKSCCNIDVNGSMISARCETNQGSMVTTSLADTSHCSDISNENGTLSCHQTSPIIGPPLPVRTPLVNLCCELQPPQGYLKYNDSLGGVCNSSYTRPICNYEDYTTAPIGRTLSVCINDPLPSGWQELSRSSDGTKCLNDIPENAVPNYQNLKSIIRKK